MKDRTAVITGATGGLGRALAEAFARNGCRLMLNGLGDADDIETWRADLQRRHAVAAVFHPANLARPDEIAAMMAQAERELGPVDIVVNNAVTRNFAAIDELPAERWDEALAVNLSSAFHTTRLAIGGMKQRNFGRIVNMASAYGVLGAADRVDYVTTKTGLIGLTRATAIELADYDITCNALCPGTVDTPAITEKIRGLAAAEGVPYDDAVRDYLKQRQPGGRFISAANVAELAVFLCGPAGRDISGATLPIDKGWVIS